MFKESSNYSDDDYQSDSEADYIEDELKQRANELIDEINKILEDICNEQKYLRRKLWELDNEKLWESLGVKGPLECFKKYFPNFSSAKLYRELNAAHVEHAIDSKAKKGKLPEGALRELYRLKKDSDMKAAWEKGLGKIPEGQKYPTASALRCIVDKMIKKGALPRKKTSQTTQKSQIASFKRAISGIHNRVLELTNRLPEGVEGRKLGKELAKELEDLREGLLKQIKV